MKRILMATILVVAASLSGCVVVPGGPPRVVYARPAVVVAPVPVVGLGVYGYRR